MAPAVAQSSGNEIAERGVVAGSQQENDVDSVVTETLQYGDSQELTVEWDRTTDIVELFVDSEKTGQTTMTQLQEQYQQEAPEQGIQGPNSGIQPMGAGCGAAMLGLGTANSILWGAAGLAVPYPPAAAVATGAGIVTGAIIGVGGLFC